MITFLFYDFGKGVGDPEVTGLLLFGGITVSSNLSGLVGW